MEVPCNLKVCPSAVLVTVLYSHLKVMFVSLNAVHAHVMNFHIKYIV